MEYTAFDPARYYKLAWLTDGVLGVALNRPPLNTYNQEYVAKWPCVADSAQELAGAPPDL